MSARYIARWKERGLLRSGGGFEPVSPERVPALFFGLLSDKYVTLQELKTTYTVRDVIALNEVILCKQENERRARAHAERS